MWYEKNHLSKEHCLPPTRNEHKIANQQQDFSYKNKMKKVLSTQYFPVEAIYEHISRLHAFWTKMPVPFENKVSSFYNF